MTTKVRRERLEREPSLWSIAKAQPQTGRGFAASKGVRIQKAASTGATIRGLHRRPRLEDCCTAETFCDGPRKLGYLWCERHVARAESIGAVYTGLDPDS